MAKKAGKVVLTILWMLVLVVLLAAVGVLRAASAQRRVWEEAAGQAAAITDAGDPALRLPAVEVADTALSPQSVRRTLQLQDRLPDNLFYRMATEWQPAYTQWSGGWDAAQTGGESVQELQVQALEWTLTVPAEAAAQLTVQDEAGQTVYDGPVEGSYTRAFTSYGTDSCQLTLQYAGDTQQDVCSYAWTVTPQVELRVYLPRESYTQGEIVPVLVEGNLLEEPMSLTTELGLCDFVPLGTPGSYGAFVPVAYNRAPGSWDIAVTVGEQEQHFAVEVQSRDFAVQYMTIDQDVADSTFNSATASAEYRAAIYPLYELTDNEKYWDGRFIEPVTGYRVSTEYGLVRYTNGVYSERHSGVDLACARGTPVLAPQGGKVLFAGYLQMTGNTVVLAHGGGVKSMFYHMDSLNVETDQLLAVGDKIGEVGSTGYSTGPHLHYEVKIGSQSIDPFPLFDGTSNLYAGQEVEESDEAA